MMLRRRRERFPLVPLIVMLATLLGGAVRAAEPPNNRTLLIVHAPHLADVAAEWSAYRSQRGWNVVLKPSVAPEDHNAGTHRRQIRQVIRDAHAAAAPSAMGDFAVMLLGDDDALPAWRFVQTDPLIMDDDRQYISDMPYQFIDDADEMPDFPLGRVSARTSDQARALLRKVQGNEALIDAGASSDRITYIAGEGRFGPMDALIESLFVMMVDRFVPEAFDLSMTYAKSSSIYCPPPSRLTDTVLQRMREPSALFNYVGHGWERGFDSLHWRGQRLPILRTNDLHRLPLADGTPIALRPVAFMSCCSVGRFDMPGDELCFSEALLFNTAGPIAIISASRISHPYANTVLQKDITRAMLHDRAPTAGMLDLLADRSLLRIDADDRELDALASLIARQMKWATTLRDLRLMHARMYNLLGDPAAELALTSESITNLQLIDGVLTGDAPGMISGEAMVHVQTPRPRSARLDELIPVNGEDDPDLELKAAHNYPLANDLLLHEATARVIDGRLELRLPVPLPDNAASIRVRIEGVNRNGMRHIAVGALRLLPPDHSR